MILAKLVKGWSICVLIAVLIVVVWSYASAHQHGLYPQHHPWPAISLVGVAAMITFVAIRTESKSVLLPCFVSAVLLMMGCATYLWALL
jgi:cytochrome bd-type quinol oxidase subunit 2